MCFCIVTEQVKFGMPPVQYVHGDDNGPDPVALGTTDESTHKNNIYGPVWNERTNERTIFFINEGKGISTILFFIQPSGKNKINKNNDGPMTSTFEAGSQALPHGHCVLRPVGYLKLFDKTCSHNVL